MSILDAALHRTEGVGQRQRGSTFRERARNGFLRSFSTVYHFPPAAIDGWYFVGVRLFTSCARTG